MLAMAQKKGFVGVVMTLIDEAAAGASPKVAKCLAASVTTRTNGVNACTDGIRRGDAEWIYSCMLRNDHRKTSVGHRVTFGVDKGAFWLMRG